MNRTDEQTTGAAGELRAQQRGLFETFHAAIDASPLGRFARFMNLGYVEVEPRSERRWSSRWERVFGRRVVSAEERLVAELVGDAPMGGRLVDIGCGRGGTLQLLANLDPALSRFGFDMSLAALARTGVNVPVVCGDGVDLPFAKGSLDVVVTIEMAHSTTAPVGLFAEISRVLRPGGWLYLADAYMVDDDPTVFLPDLGFDLVLDRSIRENVIASCHARAKRAGLRAGRTPQIAVDAEFEFAVGSAALTGLESGAVGYRVLRAQRQDVEVDFERVLADAAAATARHQSRVLGLSL